MQHLVHWTWLPASEGRPSAPQINMGSRRPLRVPSWVEPSPGCGPALCIAANVSWVPGPLRPVANNPGMGLLAASWPRTLSAGPGRVFECLAGVPLCVDPSSPSRQGPDVPAASLWPGRCRPQASHTESPNTATAVWWHRPQALGPECLGLSPSTFP